MDKSKKKKQHFEEGQNDGRSSKRDEPEKTDEEIANQTSDETEDEVKEDTHGKSKDVRTITITLSHYENIVPLHPTSDIQTRCKYLDKTLGETSLIPITDDKVIPVDESFSFKINMNSKKDIDQLISLPAILTVSQYAGICDPTLYEQLQKCDNIKNIASAKSFESIVSIYEAFTGDTVDRDVVDNVIKKAPSRIKKADKKKEKKSKEKSSKSSKPSKSSKALSKGQKQRKSGDASAESLTLEQAPSVTYGMCTIDFLPLFYGNSSYTETLTINPMETFTDERMPTYKVRPKVTVTVSIDKDLCFFRPLFLNVTIESIYNIPSVMKPDMDYKICAMLPMENSPSEPMLFSNPIYKTKPRENAMKCWPGMRRIGEDANTTKYQVSNDTIKNTIEEIDDIESSMKTVSPRLKYNMLKRNLLLKDGTCALHNQIQKYRKILLEIYMCPKEKPIRFGAKPSDPDMKGFEDKSNPSLWSIKDNKMKTAESVSRKKSQIYLHLMAVLDVSSLLYPGVSKIRVASQLTTFNFYEALRDVGVTDSYFYPKPQESNILEEVAEPEVSKNDKKAEKSKKKDKSSTTKSSKVSKKGAKKTSATDLTKLLPAKPPQPPDPEPSTPIYNENSKPTFIVVEVELSQPIFQKRAVEDLSHDLQDLLQEKIKNSSKIVLTHHLTKDYYREVLSKITKDIYDKYKQYVLIREISTVAEKDFIKYLESSGAYQTYLTSIKEAVSLLTSTKFRIDENDKKNTQLYQNYIGEIFVYLVAEMNDTLNRLVCSGLEPVVKPNPQTTDMLYLYAKEAAALGKRQLADRFFLERICYDESQNASTWFDYAVFNLEMKLFDRAYECVLEALSKKSNHRYSLLLLGVMLVIKGQKDEAETCFLNLLVLEPRWVEGWVVLYLFYQKYDKYDGMDLAMDMIKKYLDDERITQDYFTETEDLLWTSKICPKTMYFRTAALLLKMRVYEWVEMALVHEVQEHFGITHYLLSAVCFYRELYEQALEHIQHTKAYCGPNYAVSSLSGHCLFALERYHEAREDYYHVLTSLDRPDDVHMVYVNCSQILDNSGDHQEARKLILLACKYSPTHYTWYRAGQLYLQENDLLSAEECFSEANFKDNRCAEYWGYLTLINLQLNRTNEAELCYSQAIKNNLDEAMHEKIRKEFKKVTSMAV